MKNKLVLIILMTICFDCFSLEKDLEIDASNKFTSFYFENLENITLKNYDFILQIFFQNKNEINTLDSNVEFLISNINLTEKSQNDFITALNESVNENNYKN